MGNKHSVRHSAQLSRENQSNITSGHVATVMACILFSDSTLRFATIWILSFLTTHYRGEEVTMIDEML